MFNPPRTSRRPIKPRAMMVFLFIGRESKKMNHDRNKTDPRISIEDMSLARPDRPSYGRLSQQSPQGQVLLQAERLGIPPENRAHVIAFGLFCRIFLGSDRRLERLSLRRRFVLLNGRCPKEQGENDRSGPRQHSLLHWF